MNGCGGIMLEAPVARGGWKFGEKKNEEKGFYCLEKRAKKTFFSLFFFSLFVVLLRFFFFPLIFPLSPRDCVVPCN